MTDYMLRDSDDTGPWDDTPFTPTYRLRGDPSDRKGELTRQNAKKIRDKVLRSDSITTDEAVETAMATLDRSHKPSAFYYHTCGPVAASADDVRWNSAFRIDLDVAPEPKSDEWERVASEFNLSQQDDRDLVPEKIVHCYHKLVEKTRENDGDRAMHPGELADYGPVVRDRPRQTAFDCLSQVPGVDGPDSSRPAWELVEADEEVSTGAASIDEVQA